ncbi:hypothetical protein [Polyangium aurulentum]|uniref:hypothetical protein n=1 Tax=Polyangium aurulentum TaxID=2567896 RepID=UPI0010AE3859|nr:hypothetical protein [Polyangium aurulentum]UQA56435.1 hypothetical protein E8A73_034745 [Polyangium aurulentum]
MKAYTLEIDELAALVGFLNAKKLVGLDEKLFLAFSEENLPHLVAKLHAHGWLHPAERPGTWHMNEDLMQTLATAVSPHFAVLARSKAHGKSAVFYEADHEVTQIVVTDDRAVVASLDGIDALASEVTDFLRDARPGEVGVARVNARGDGMEAGRHAVVDESGLLRTKTPGLLPASENAWTAENVAAFVRGAMADLGVAVAKG